MAVIANRLSLAFILRLTNSDNDTIQRKKHLRFLYTNILREGCKLVSVYLSEKGSEYAMKSEADCFCIANVLNFKTNNKLYVHVR